MSRDSLSSTALAVKRIKECLKTILSKPLLRDGKSANIFLSAVILRMKPPFGFS